MIDMENNSVYDGLSTGDAVRKYRKMVRNLYSDWERPLQKIIEKAISDRIREVDGRGKERAASEGDYYTVRLPLYFRTEEDSTPLYWEFLDSRINISVDVRLSRFKPDDGGKNSDVVYKTCFDLEELIQLYRALEAAGFWNDENKEYWQL